MNNEERNDRELVLTREVRFPPDDFKNEDVKMDFRIGGSWTFVMLAPH